VWILWTCVLWYLVYIFNSSIFWDTRRWMKSKSTIRKIYMFHINTSCKLNDSNSAVLWYIHTDLIFTVIHKKIVQLPASQTWIICFRGKWFMKHPLFNINCIFLQSTNKYVMMNAFSVPEHYYKYYKDLFSIQYETTVT
jgi:hypothetical protein